MKTYGTETKRIKKKYQNYFQKHIAKYENSKIAINLFY